MPETIPSPRNITNYLLSKPKLEKSWRLKSQIGNVIGIFHVYYHSSEHNLYKLKIELDIFPDGDAYFFNKEDKERKKELEEIFKKLIRTTVKKSSFYITNSLIIIFITNDTNKEKRNTELFSVIEKILEFVSMDNSVRSMNINLRKKHRDSSIKKKT